MIKQSIESFISLGPVGRDQSENIVQEFSALLKDKLNVMKLDKIQIELIIYKFKLIHLRQWKIDETISSRKKYAKEKLSSLESEVFQSENNMGYFSISKGAEKLPVR